MNRKAVKHKLPTQLYNREVGLRRRICTDSWETSSRLQRNLINCWSQRSLNIGEKNKVFASCWLSEDHVIYGTKCNRLSVLDITSSKEYSIPLLRGADSATSTSAKSSKLSAISSAADFCHCGIHAIKTNPSNVFLATGGQNVREVGVYELPELKPVCVLGGAHSDWVFDLCWLNDETLVSCSRDASLAVWRVNPDRRPFTQFQDGHGLDDPICHLKAMHPDDKFRSVDYARDYNVLGVLTMSSRLYLYDPVRLLDGKTSLSRFNMGPDIKETVSVRRCPSRSELLSICSQSQVVCLDVRCSTRRPTAFEIKSIHGDCGIRSINFKGDLLSYGTSQGGVLFYDMRARKHLAQSGIAAQLDIGPGWLRWDDCDVPRVIDPAYHHPTTAAVYTHEYDPGGARLFAAGGPIAAAYYGNVACIWE